MPARRADGWLVWVLTGWLAVGCASRDTVYDYGDGPVDSRGRSELKLDEPTLGDLERETESNAEATADEAFEDAVPDSER